MNSIGEKLLRKQGWNEERKIIGTSGNGLEKPIDAFEQTGDQGLGYDKSCTHKYTASSTWTATHVQPFHEVLERANKKEKVVEKKKKEEEDDSSDDGVPMVFQPEEGRVKKSPILGARRVPYTRRIKMRTEANKCVRSLGEILGTQAKRERE